MLKVSRKELLERLIDLWAKYEFMNKDPRNPITLDEIPDQLYSWLVENTLQSMQDSGVPNDSVFDILEECGISSQLVDVFRTISKMREEEDKTEDTPPTDTSKLH